MLSERITEVTYSISVQAFILQNISFYSR